jgi:ribonuclease-3
MELGDALLMGEGERRSGGADKVSLLANAFEAVVAAIYLDGGIEPATHFVESSFGPDIARASSLSRDVKTELQEYCQKTAHQLPRYTVVAELGPEHAREFVCEVWVSDQLLGSGRGKSKKHAERQAAEAALDGLNKGSK